MRGVRSGEERIIDVTLDKTAGNMLDEQTTVPLLGDRLSSFRGALGEDDADEECPLRPLCSSASRLETRLRLGESLLSSP